MYKKKHNFLLEGEVNPENASAALLFYKKKILLQKRDNKKNIFYPGYYSFFGGGKKNKESYLSCIKREIYEEINIKVKMKDFKFLCKNMLDFSPIKKNKVYRYYYVKTLSTLEFKKIKLNEGKNLQLFEIHNLLKSSTKIAPYDAFVLWLYAYKQKNYK